MLKRIDGYWMSAIAPGGVVLRLTLDPLPPGTNVYASISLSAVSTMFVSPDPPFWCVASVESWTFYMADGTESAPQTGMGDHQNAVAVDNCARITFALVALQAYAIAQVNIFTF
jgi:hypothetical protein